MSSPRETTDEPTTRASIPGEPLPADPSSPPGLAATPPPAIPQRFEDRYHIHGEIGRGGMGVVSSYQDHQLGRRIALKVLRPQAHEGRTEALRGRFVDEARLQAQLEHPSVVPVYELGVAPDERIYFTMMHVRGVTLHAIIEELEAGDRAAMQRWSRRQLLNAFGRVCLAVQFAHERGVVHRDLKPDNVMLGEYGEVYVLDWGIALRTDETSIASARDRAGTPGYMAPEQARGEALGPTADVYALGVMLRELITLAPPTASRAGASSDPPPELEALVEQATVHDPAVRLPSARALFEALERFLDGERDLERRAAMAEQHAAAAHAAAERAAAAGDDAEGETAIAARREAMREVGRALALAPEHAGAMTTMLRLLSRPPSRLPAEAAAALETRRAATRAWSGRVATFAYLSVLGYWPLFWWAGIRELVPLLVLSGLALLSAATAFGVSRQPRPSSRAVLPTMVLSTMLMGSTAMLFGPLVLAPTLVATNTASYALILRGMHRWLAVLVGCLVIAIPLVPTMLGWWPGGYAFGPEGMMTRAHALDLAGHGAFALLAISSVAAVVTATVAVAGVRRDLDEAQRALELYGWHFRQLVPPG